MKKWMYCEQCKKWYLVEQATVNRCLCGCELKGADDNHDYERAMEQMEHDILYEPTYNPKDGSM